MVQASQGQGWGAPVARDQLVGPLNYLLHQLWNSTDLILTVLQARVQGGLQSNIQVLVGCPPSTGARGGSSSQGLPCCLRPGPPPTWARSTASPASPGLWHVALSSHTWTCDHTARTPSLTVRDDLPSQGQLITGHSSVCNLHLLCHVTHVTTGLEQDVHVFGDQLFHLRLAFFPPCF